ncbi:MAG: L-cystine-binding protein FliY [Burkholderia plantarii]|nr:MAG: L-cystine-binding protein FliY [Burkholderia plantarii]
MTQRRHFLGSLAALAAATTTAGIAPAFAQTRTFDFSPQQRGRVRAQPDPALPAQWHGYRFVTPGKLSVAVSPFAPPIATYATDAQTVVGSDPDYAQLLADALGLSLSLVVIAWADWPLGLASGKYDAVISNVGVTEKRKQKFDFTTYRLGLHAFYVPNASPIHAIREPKDVAGLRIITGSGTI